MQEITEKQKLNWESFPMTLRPKHVKEIMELSQAKLYEFLGDAPFHVAKAGRGLYISKTVFRNWLEDRRDDIFPDDRMN